MQGPQLGLGLIGIGRIWGHQPQEVAKESDARALLEAAFDMGIAIYDTAPAYGLSEARLGQFLRGLDREARESIFIATKMGEHWNGDGTTRLDHSYEAMMRSLDSSVEHLRDIDLLHIHGATVEALGGADIPWVIEAARAMDIPNLGASVRDVAAARLALEMGFEVLQFAFNASNEAMLPIFDEARAAGVTVMTNRPLASGAAIVECDAETRAGLLEAAYARCLQANPGGVILTGTRSAAHIKENLAAFRRSLEI